MAFPATLDTPKSTWLPGETPTSHSSHHNALAIAIMAMQAKIGIDNSIDTNSLDYKIRNSTWDWGKVLMPLAPFFYYNGMDSWWIDWFGTVPAISFDSSVKITWTASLKIDLPDTGAVKNAMKIVPVMNLSNPHGFRFKIRCPDWTKVNTLDLNFGTSGMAAYWTCNIFDKLNKAVLEPDAWIEVVLSKADFSLDTGAIDWSAVTNIYFRSSSILGQTDNVWIEEFGIFKQDPFWKNLGATIICADDGWATQFTNMKPLLDKYGLKATFFIIPAAVGTAGYMTQDQIQQLHDEGHCIALHGATALTNFAWPALEAEVNSILAYKTLHKDYTGMKLFALPNGRTNAEVEALLKTKFDVNFSIDEQIGYPYMYMGYRFPRRSVIRTSLPSVHTTNAVTTKTHKGLQLLNFHHVVPTATIDEEYSTADLETILSFLANPVNDIYCPRLDQFIYNVL